MKFSKEDRDRFYLMASGDPTWDLSVNDLGALIQAKRYIEWLEERVATLHDALKDPLRDYPE